MKLAEALAILKTHKRAWSAQYGLTKLGIFGSVARGQESELSDVDVVVEVEVSNAWDYLKLREEIETALGGEVDIIRLRNGLREPLKTNIEREAIYA